MKLKEREKKIRMAVLSLLEEYQSIQAEFFTEGGFGLSRIDVFEIIDDEDHITISVYRDFKFTLNFEIYKDGTGRISSRSIKDKRIYEFRKKLLKFITMEFGTNVHSISFVLEAAEFDSRRSAVCSETSAGNGEVDIVWSIFNTNDYDTNIVEFKDNAYYYKHFLSKADMDTPLTVGEVYYFALGGKSKRMKEFARKHINNYFYELESKGRKPYTKRAMLKELG